MAPVYTRIPARVRIHTTALANAYTTATVIKMSDARELIIVVAFGHSFARLCARCIASCILAMRRMSLGIGRPRPKSGVSGLE